MVTRLAPASAKSWMAARLLNWPEKPKARTALRSTPGELGELVEGVPTTLDLLCSDTVGHPAMAPCHDALEDMARGAAQQKGRMWFLDEFGAGEHQRKFIVLKIVISLIAGPDLLHGERNLLSSCCM